MSSDPKTPRPETSEHTDKLDSGTEKTVPDDLEAGGAAATPAATTASLPLDDAEIIDGDIPGSAN